MESFPCAGFAREETNMPGAVKELIGKLETADIILTSASPWDEKASLYKNTGLNSEYFPKLSESVGLISGIFLDANGKEVLGKYTTIGLGYKGFIKAAERGAVILMCGGEDRREILYSSLKARMVSTLITTSKTAKMLLKAI